MNKKETMEMDINEKNFGKKLNSIIAIVFVILIVICIIGYKYSIKNYDRILSEFEEEEEEENYTNVEVATQLFTAEEYPDVQCTALTMQMAKKFKANFTKEDESNLNINVSTKSEILQNLIKGNTDVILVTELSKEEIQKAKNSGAELKSYKIANEALIFLTNTRNEVNNLTLKQIQKIYTGEVKKWSELGGKSEEIIACQRNEKSETQGGMSLLVMKGLESIKSSKENTIADESTLSSVIANYKSNPGVIGYTYASNVIYNENVKMLSVNGVPVNYETIRNETYPIKTGYYVVIKKSDEKNKKIKKLVEAITSKRGKKLLEDAGYIISKK